MIKFEFEIEDVKGSIVRQEDGLYLLTLIEGEEKFTSKIKGDQAASILFFSFDPGYEEFQDAYNDAKLALGGSNIEMIP